MTLLKYLEPIFFVFLVGSSFYSFAGEPSNEIKKDKKSNSQSALKVLWTERESPVPFKVEVIAEGLGIPWGMLFLNKEELLWTERKGHIKKIHIPTRKITEISGGPTVHARWQGGLLDVALHPKFKENKWIYFTYSIKEKTKQTTALGRGRLKGNKITGLKILFTAEPFSYGHAHFGSRLAFDNKGFLFMTVGDRKKRGSAQKLNSHSGKILRLDDKGRAAKDNPFTKIKEAKPEIWSFGHRNPQGLFIHPDTNKLWSHEHGPKGGDEINLIRKGGNYGWPVVSHGRNYSGFRISEKPFRKGMLSPIKHWTPSIAPCGLLIYSGKKFPKWKGDFFSGALVLTHLNQLKILNKNNHIEKRWFSPLGFRFRHVIEGPQGFIYASVDQGMILKISPLQPSPD